MRHLALNFFPLTTTEFSFNLYCHPYNQAKRPSIGNESAVRRSIPINGQYRIYWTLFQESRGSVQVSCQPLDNIYGTLAALRLAIIKSCQENLHRDSFRVIDDFRHYVEVIYKRHNEGNQVISIEPYFLRARHQFGVLVDFRYHPKEEYIGTRRSSQLSLALDKHGHPNLDYYADRYSILVEFVDKLHKLIFPLVLPDGQQITVSDRLVRLPLHVLAVKQYVVGDGKTSSSQFMGVKEFGPLEEIEHHTHLYFLYLKEDQLLSRDLFRALRGDTFLTFPGMQEMFDFSISRRNVTGVVINDFSEEEILNVRDRVFEHASRKKTIVAVVVTPFSRYDKPDRNAAYWHLKHSFLEKSLPIQVVASETISERERLKWSISGIGLQIFAKAGGTPWKVKSPKNRCLIIGVGQAHHRVASGTERFFAYCVLLDSSGVFREVRVLGKADNEAVYVERLKETLESIIRDYSNDFSQFVVHAPFGIRRDDLNTINSVLADKLGRTDRDPLVSLKFNSRSRFFGFSVNHNSRVPHESSVIRLARTEFLVWFEGLQYGQYRLRKTASNPLHVQFTYPRDVLPREEQRAHLQDAINLSGANWRGFNAKSLPVSVYYAQLIARYLKEFEKHQLPAIDVNILLPWFL